MKARTRFVCRAGENRFETFDFESLRWLQLPYLFRVGSDDGVETGKRLPSLRNT